MPVGSDPHQDYIEQVMLKPKNLSTVQLIQILQQSDIMPIDSIEQNLESFINKTYQEIDFEDPVAIISQIITDGVCHSRHYSLLDYSLENRLLYHYSNLYLPNKDWLLLRVPQKPYD